MATLLLLTACGSETKKQRDFFTSGSREADQRAEQRVAKDQQLRGEGGTGSSSDKSSGNVKPSLYTRLGGRQSIDTIVDDFVTRALADPRVNWERKGVKRSVFSFKADRSLEWKASKENVDQLKKHLAQFLALATGGPAKYDGRDMRDAHKGLQITNAEFDAVVGDLKASLDKLGVPVPEQKELLAVVESTRTQVVEER